MRVASKWPPMQRPVLLVFSNRLRPVPLRRLHGYQKTPFSPSHWWRPWIDVPVRSTSCWWSGWFAVNHHTQPFQLIHRLTICVRHTWVQTSLFVTPAVGSQKSCSALMSAPVTPALPRPPATISVPPPTQASGQGNESLSSPALSQLLNKHS